MKKMIKILAFVLGGAVVLLLAAVLILPKVIDLNDFKPEIAELIEKNTGCRVFFDGPIALEVLPSLKLNLQDLRVLPATNAFGETPLASLRQLDLHVELFPLLSKRLEVKSALLSGAELNLFTNRQGLNTWDMPSAAAPEQSTGATGATDAEGAGAGKADGAKPRFSAKVDELRLGDCRVNFKNEREGQNFSLLLSALELDNLGLGQSMNLLLDLAYDDKAAKRSVGLKLNGQARLDGAERSALLDIPALTLSLRGPTQKNAESVNGRFKAKADFAGGNQPASGALNGLDWLAEAELELGELDLDKFLAEAPAQPASAPAQAGKGAAAQPAPAAQSALLKGTPLEKGRLDCRLSVKGLTIQNVPLQNIKGSLSLNKGVAELKSFNLNALGGEVKASGRANLLQMKPPVSLKASVKGLDLLKTGQTLAETKKISGRVNLETELSFKGLDGDAIKRSLNGNGSVSSDKAAPLKLQDFQLIPADAPAELLKLRQSDYVFDSLTGSFTATNGVICNSDLVLASPSLGVKGGGVLNLPGNSIDYRATLQAGKLTLPVKAAGPLSKIGYGLDGEALGKRVVGGVLQELEKGGKLTTGNAEKDESLQKLGKGLQQILDGKKK